MIRFILLLLISLLGFWMGKDSKGLRNEKVQAAINIVPDKDFPLVEHKSFAIVIYIHNDSLWCEKTLRSVFEQDYDNYRVVVVDDGSSDGTGERVKQFIDGHNQDSRVILIQNKESIGPVASLYRAIDTCLDREIVLPINGKDWLSSPSVLNKINSAYQNPDVWMTFGQSIDYPSYVITEPERREAFCSYYAGLFKQVHLQDLFKEGKFSRSAASYLNPMIDLSGGRIRNLREPIAFSNSARPRRIESEPLEIAKYNPLSSFPQKSGGKTDILLFSFDRPLQLYACLESIQRYITGFENLIVLYRASDTQYELGYEKLKGDFPLVHFVSQSADPKRDFKKNVMKLVFGSSTDYILFGVDDVIVKDFVDLSSCMELMDRTGAYGFYLRFGRHIKHCYQNGQSQEIPPSLSLANGVYAWDIPRAQGDWGFPNNLDMTLFRKETLKEPFEKLTFKTPNSLEFTWAKDFRPESAIGLYFDSSKIVNIPMNVVGKTGNPHMSELPTEELLAKFNRGLKIDIDPLYKVENVSPHMEYIPEFISR